MAIDVQKELSAAEARLVADAIERKFAEGGDNPTRPSSDAPPG